MSARASSHGRVVGLFLAGLAEQPVIPVDEVVAVQGRGLEGDRYFTGRGTFSDRPGTGRAVTLIELEAVDAARRDYGLDVDAAATRRNIVTAGVALNDLVGFEFSIGETLLRGMRLCHPCKEMAALAGLPDLLRALHDRGGLRADVVRGGHIRVGDAVRRVGPAGKEGRERE